MTVRYVTFFSINFILLHQILHQPLYQFFQKSFVLTLITQLLF